LQNAIDNGSGETTFAQIKNAHAAMAEMIHDTMPQLPVFKGYFYLLRVITWALHYVLMMSKSGRVPDVSRSLQGAYVPTFPPFFPPLPVRSVITATIQLSLGETLAGMAASPDYARIVSGMNQYLLSQELSDELNELLWKTAEQLYRAKLEAAFARADLEGRLPHELRLDAFHKSF
jgi:hypothetical protein